MAWVGRRQNRTSCHPPHENPAVALLRTKLETVSTDQQNAQPPSKFSKMREKMAAMLDKTSSSDAELEKKRGGGETWIRKDMQDVSGKLKSDEVHVLGVESGSVGAGERALLISRINCEETETLFHGERSDRDEAILSTSKTSSANQTVISKRELLHHDAMFASVPLDAPEQPTVSADKEPQQSSTPESRLFARPPQRPPSPDGDDGFRPLFTRLRVGQEVRARYSEDQLYYDAVITQVIHGGFSNAMYTVRYSAFGNEESRSWKDITPLNNEGVDEPLPKRQRPLDQVPQLSGSSMPGLGATAPKDQTTTEIPPPVALNPAVLQRASQSQGGWRARAKRK